MASIRERIIQTITDEIASALAPVGVYRSREIPLTRELSPALVVTPIEEQHRPDSQIVEVNTLLVRVEVLVRGDPFDSLADPLVMLAHKTVMQSPALAALCSHHRRSTPTTFEAQDADFTFGIVSTPYEFIYHTLLSDLETVNF